MEKQVTVVVHKDMVIQSWCFDCNTNTDHKVTGNYAPGRPLMCMRCGKGSKKAVPNMACPVCGKTRGNTGKAFNKETLASHVYFAHPDYQQGDP